MDTQSQIINQNAANNSEVQNFQKQMIAKAQKEIAQIEEEINQLEENQ